MESDYLLGTVSPTINMVVKGYTAFILCHSIGRVYWTKDGNTTQGHAGIAELIDVLILLKVEESYSGWYTCHGYLLGFVPFTAKSLLLVGGTFQYLNQYKVYVYELHEWKKTTTS